LLKTVLTSFYKGLYNPKYEAYGITDEMFKQRLLSFAYIQNYTTPYAAFRNESVPSNALKNQLEELEKAGVLEKLNVVEALQYKKRGLWYRLIDPTLI
jgi:hypothetical protein